MKRLASGACASFCLALAIVCAAQDCPPSWYPDGYREGGWYYAAGRDGNGDPIKAEDHAVQRLRKLLTGDDKGLSKEVVTKYQHDERSVACNGVAYALIRISEEQVEKNKREIEIKERERKKAEELRNQEEERKRAEEARRERLERKRKRREDDLKKTQDEQRKRRKKKDDARKRSGRNERPSNGTA